MPKTAVLFNNSHVHEYAQGKLVGLAPKKVYWWQWWRKYDGLNYQHTLLEGGPDQRYYGSRSLADLVIETGMVMSRAKLKTLKKDGGITAQRWHKTVEDWNGPIPWEEAEYLVRKGQRILEVVVEVKP